MHFGGIVFRHARDIELGELDGAEIGLGNPHVEVGTKRRAPHERHREVRPRIEPRPETRRIGRRELVLDLRARSTTRILSDVHGASERRERAQPAPQRKPRSYGESERHTQIERLLAIGEKRKLRRLKVRKVRAGHDVGRAAREEAEHHRLWTDAERDEHTEKRAARRGRGETARCAAALDIEREDRIVKADRQLRLPCQRQRGGVHEGSFTAAIPGRAGAPGRLRSWSDAEDVSGRGAGIDLEERSREKADERRTSRAPRRSHRSSTTRNYGAPGALTAGSENTLTPKRSSRYRARPTTLSDAER